MLEFASDSTAQHQLKKRDPQNLPVRAPNHINNKRSSYLCSALRSLHWHFVERVMGRSRTLFFLALLTLSVLVSALEGSTTNPEPARFRTLLQKQNPEAEKSIADPPNKEAPLSAAETNINIDDDGREAEDPEYWESRKLGRHHSLDRSVAGGGVIIGGLVTAIFAAVYCYIRVTRRRPAARALT